MKVSFRHVASTVLTRSIFALLAVHFVRLGTAATETWVGTTNLWNNAANWSGLNLPPASNDSLVFGAAGAGGLNLNNDLTNGSFNLAGLTFEALAPAYTIGNGTTTANAGNPFVLTGAIVDHSASIETINNPFSMAATQSFTSSVSGGNLVLGGVVSGAGGVVKEGAGTVTMSQVSTFTGATVVNAGTLSLTNGNSPSGTLSGTATITVNAGGTLELTNQDTLGYTAGKQALIINGGRVLNNGAATRSTLQNTVTMTGGILGGTSAGDGNGAYSINAATLIAATSDASGTAALINAGKISIQATGAPIISVTRGANAAAVSDLTITSQIASFGGNGAGFTKTGNGILTLSGSNNYTGSTLVNAGTVTFSGGTSTGSTTLFVHGTTALPAAVRVEAGASVTIAGPIAIAQITGDTNGSLTIAGGTLASTGLGSYFTIADNGAANPGGNAVGTVTQTGGALNLGVSGTPINYASVGAAGVGTYALSGGSVSSYTANGFNIGDRTGAVGSMTVSGTGTLNVFTSDGIFIGKATSNSVTSGTLNIDTGGSVSTTKVTFGGAGAGSLVYGSLNVNGGTLSVGIGGLTESSASVVGSVHFNGGTFKSTAAFSIAASMGLTLDAGGVAIDTTGGSIISASPLVLGLGAGAVAISGGNGLTLPAGNNYLGATSLTGAGTALKLSAATTLAGNLGLGAGTIFDLNGNSQSIGGLSDVAGGAGAVINSGAASKTLTLTGAGSYSFGGVYSGGINAATAGNSGLTAALAPTGMQTLSATQLFTGSTAVTGGTLRLDFSGANAPASNIINGAANSSTLTLGGGTLSLLAASGATNSQRFNGVMLAASSGSAFSVTETSGATVNATLGAVTRSAQSAVNFTLPTVGTITAATANSGTATGNIVTTADGIAYATSGGSHWATNVGGALGTLATTANDTFGATDNANVTVDDAPAPFTAHTLRFNVASKTLTLSGGSAATPSTVSSGGILVTAVTAGAGGAATIAGGTNAQLRGAGGATKELLIHSFGQLNINVPIVDNGAASALTLAGTGLTVLNSANAFTGPTAIVGGTARIANLNALGSNAAGTTVGSGGALELGVGGTVAGEALTLNGSGPTGNGALIASNSGAWSGAVTIASPATINVAPGAIWSISTGSALTGNALLTKLGAGTLSITGGGSTGSGGLAINGGTVAIPDSTGRWGSGNISVNSSGTFLTAGSGTDTVLGGVLITVRSGGAFDFQQTGGETITTVQINGDGIGGAGALVNSAATASGAMTVTNGVMLQSHSAIGVSNIAGSLTLASPVTGPFNLTKVGAGRLIFTTNNNTVTGAVSINAGTVQTAGTNNSFAGFYGASSVTINNGATWEIAVSNNVTGNGTAAGNFVPITVNTGGTLAALANTSSHIRSLLTLRGGSVTEPTVDSSGFGNLNLDGGVAAGGVPATSVISALGVTSSQVGGTIFNVSPGAANGMDLDVTGTLINAANVTETTLIKTGTGTMRLANVNSYDTPTEVRAGALLVSGSISGTQPVKVATGATLGGSGTVGPIVALTNNIDAGLLSPGRGAGILTAPSAAGGTGLSYGFEMTQSGSPTYGSAAASGNDLLHLTTGTTPFSGNLTLGNNVAIYFDHANDTYRGGFYAFDGQATPDVKLQLAVGSASYSYYLKDASGSLIFGGNSYSPLSNALVIRSYVSEVAAFSSGTVSGAQLQFVVIPEPTSFAVLVVTFCPLLGLRRARKTFR